MTAIVYVHKLFDTEKDHKESRVTIVEIAKRAGVSIGTVDRVVHGRGHVSAEKERRIREIIDAEGYQPNPIARHLKRGESFRIGVLLPELEKESRYWDLIWTAIREAFDGLSAFSFTPELFAYERTNRASLEGAFARMAQADCRAWVIAPVMQEEIADLIGASGPRPPICFIDTAMPGVDAVTTVAQDPEKGGIVAGRLMELLAPGPGTYAVIRPYLGAFNLNERARGFRERFSGKPDVRVIDLVCPETEPAEPGRSLDAAFAEYPDLRGLFAVTAFGHKVAAYLDSRPAFPAGRPALIGYDLVEENARRLRDGSIDCIISQRPTEQGRLAVHQLYRRFVLGESPAADIRVPIDVFFKENLDE